jgi:hypothetical protein
MPYIHNVTVTVKAPKGYSPRVKRIKGAVVSHKLSYKEKAEERMMAVVKKALEEENERIGLEFSATTDTHSVKIFLSDLDESEP